MAFVKEERVDAESEVLLGRMFLEKAAAEEKEDYDMAREMKTIIEQVRTYGEQIRLCDEGKALMAKQEQYEEAKELKTRRDQLKIKRDRVINEQLQQYGFSLYYFLHRTYSPRDPEQSSKPSGNQPISTDYVEKTPVPFVPSPQRQPVPDKPPTKVVSTESLAEPKGVEIRPVR